VIVASFCNLAVIVATSMSFVDVFTSSVQSGNLLTYAGSPEESTSGVALGAILFEIEGASFMLCTVLMTHSLGLHIPMTNSFGLYIQATASFPFGESLASFNKVGAASGFA